MLNGQVIKVMDGYSYRIWTIIAIQLGLAIETIHLTAVGKEQRLDQLFRSNIGNDDFLMPVPESESISGHRIYSFAWFANSTR